MMAVLFMAVMAASAVCGQDTARETLPVTSSRTASPDIERAASSRAGDMIIGPDDQLRIRVFDVPQLSGEFLVSARGAITMPLLSEPISASGRTPDQLARAISTALESQELVSHPRVTVEVKRARRYSVVIGGAVHKPQIVSLSGRMSLADLLAQAQGLSADAGEYAVITRAPAAGANAKVDAPDLAGETTAREIVDLKQLTDGSAPVYVYPGDRVTVERAGVVYVTGAVNRAGGFELTGSRGRMTVLKAVALAEGLKSTAVRNRAFILREDARNPSSRAELAVDLREILAGRAPDIPMRPSDILFIPDSTSQKALRRAAEAAVDITTGVIIFRR